jgi:hypothetical protein
MSEFVIKRGDLLPSVRMVVANRDTSAFDFTGYTAPIFIMRLSGAAAPQVAGPAAFDDVVGGVLRYDWQAGDTAVEGTFKCEFQALDPFGKKRTFPSSGYGVVRVLEDLNDLSESCVCALVPNVGTPDRAIVIYSGLAAGPIVQEDAWIDGDGKLFAVGADFSASISIVGDVALSGTVDGRDVSEDGAALELLTARVEALEASVAALEAIVHAG